VVAELMDTPDPADELVAEVIRAVESAGGLDYARRRALELAQQAETELEALPPSAARDALRDSIAYAWNGAADPVAHDRGARYFTRSARDGLRPGRVACTRCCGDSCPRARPRNSSPPVTPTLRAGAPRPCWWCRSPLGPIGLTVSLLSWSVSRSAYFVARSLF